MAELPAPPFDLRQATPADVRAINHLRINVRENRLSDPSVITVAMTIEAITETGRGWVAEANGILLGFSIALAEDRSVWALFVAPEHEGKGAGTALLDAAADWLWQLGDEPIWLSTDPGTRAEAFYRARGWQPCGLRDNGEMLFRLFSPERTREPESQSE